MAGFRYDNTHSNATFPAWNTLIEWGHTMTTHFPYRVIDLTHTLDENSPAWNGDCGFRHERKLDYDQCPGEVKFRVQQIKMHGGIGTHIDAPAHVVPGGITVEGLALNDLVRPCVCIDVSQKANAAFKLSAQDILAFESAHTRIQPEDFVIIYTGWDTYWHEPKRYHNQYQFPSLSESAVQCLLERNIAGLGIDTLSPDCPDSGFPAHKYLLGAGKYIVENVANASELPPMGFTTLALPLKGQGLTEAPLRLVGLIQE